VKKIIVLATVLGIAVSVCTAQKGKPSSAPVRIAYVNSEKILAELPDAQAVRKEIETTVQGWQDTYQKMVKDFQDQSDDYQKKQSLLDPKVKADKEKALDDLRKQIIDYQAQKFDQREGEAVKLREQKFKPIQDRVMKVIKQVAQENGFNYVFDNLENATNILYADTKFDLTYVVIDRLKRGGASKSDDSSK